MVATVLGAWLVAWGPSGGGSSAQPTTTAAPDELPFTIVVNAFQPAGVGSISQLPPTKVPPRPTDGDWPTWKRAASAVSADTLEVEFTIQGRSDAQVVLTALEVRVVTRRPALTGTVFLPAGGDPTAFRAINADLDHDPPALSSHYDDGMIPGNVPQPHRRPMEFPYEVSISDAETFDVFGDAEKCDCSWVVDLSWASQGRTGTVLIDDGGKPFRVTGTHNATAFCVLDFDGQENCSPPAEYWGCSVDPKSPHC